MDNKIIMRMSKNERYLLYLALICITCFVLNRMILHPLLGKSGNLHRQIQLKSRLLEHSLYLFSQKEVILNESVKYADYARQRLSEEEETASFLKEIEDKAKNTGVLLIDLKPYPAKKIDSFYEYKVDVEAESSMDQLMTFIFNLQASEKILRVPKLQLSPKSENPNILKTRLTINMVLIP